MNKHLKLVREFQDASSLPQAEQGTSVHLSDMDIIMRQALLMEAGSEIFKAMKAGEMAAILAGLINLSYSSLGGIAMRGEDVIDQPVSWQHDGFVLSLMRILSDRINNCATGNTDNYSEIYCLCVHLSKNYLNADFDKAFQMAHDHRMSKLRDNGQSINEDADKTGKSKRLKAPDLTECFYE
ncbi:MAG: nucleoside triphosphate pyrophosphohydrolase family protein [Methylobacter sp.]|nr:nucleoside triphosphate pyrophosphohydrolase family protein [Methylobacter sp.]